MKNKETPCPIDPEDIRVGDRVRKTLRIDDDEYLLTQEFTVKKIDTLHGYLQFRYTDTAWIINSGTYELLHRPAPPMEPLPTEVGAVIWVDAIEGVALDKPVKAMLNVDDCWLLADWDVRKGKDITAWHAVAPEHRTVSTAEELDNSRYGAVIRSELDGVAQNRGGYWQQIGSGHKFSSADIAGGWKAPFTVIWEAGE